MHDFVDNDAGDGAAGGGAGGDGAVEENADGDLDTAMLVHRAAGGDEWAWRALVDRHGRIVWAVARSHGLGDADADDVVQATWLLLAENLDRLREPAALPGWLTTVARNESLRLLRLGNRESPSGLRTVLLERPDPDGPEDRVLRTATATRLWQAFSGLSQRCQQLLRVLAVAPEASYQQVSKAMGIAVGTIGPKKHRCLADLRKRMTTGDVPEEAAG